MHIRAPKTEDAKAIAKVHLEVWQSAYRGIMSEEFLNSLDIQQLETSWAHSLKHPGNGNYLVAEIENNIVAFSTFGPARDEDLKKNRSAELVAINVSPAYWRREIGSQLLSKIIAHLKKDFDNLYLWVAENNFNAIAFYTKHNFRPDGKIKTDSRHCYIVEKRHIAPLR